MKKFITTLLPASILFISSITNAACETAIIEGEFSTPNGQLIDNGDGTITDLATSLMWIQCSEGQTYGDPLCNGDLVKSDWATALSSPSVLNANGGFGGFSEDTNYTDWRLPNVKELRSLVEEACVNPSINIERFPETDNTRYWTSTTSINAPDGETPSGSWGVSFLDGVSEVTSRGEMHAVRLVRDIP